MSPLDFKRGNRRRPLLDVHEGAFDDLDLRGFEEMDADDETFAVVARESLFGLPARPGTVRR